MTRAIKTWIVTAALAASLCLLAACDLDTTATPAPDGSSAGVPVDSVVDGDTIRVVIDGEMERVRLIGVDTPEVQPEVQCFGDEARAFVEGLLAPGALVELERDVSETDRFDRLLRYVYLEDGRMLNELLLEQGYAHVVVFPPDTRNLDAFRDLEASARDEGRGRWSACPSDADSG